MRVFLLGLMLPLASQGAAIRQSVTCPQDSQESCRWEISSRFNGTQVQLAWEKVVVSRHFEKPLSNTLQCNVDRDFDPAGGGFLKVWFKGEKLPCDAMAGNPADCGVTFLLQDPKELVSAYGANVEAPKGKRLEKVELYNTLNLQCGNFGSKDFDQRKWSPTVGWSAQAPGDGTYSK